MFICVIYSICMRTRTRDATAQSAWYSRRDLPSKQLKHRDDISKYMENMEALIKALIKAQVTLWTPCIWTVASLLDHPTKHMKRLPKIAWTMVGILVTLGLGITTVDYWTWMILYLYVLLSCLFHHQALQDNCCHHLHRALLIKN